MDDISLKLAKPFPKTLSNPLFTVDVTLGHFFLIVNISSIF